MRLLLDTHIALWAIADSPQLPNRAAALIADPENEVAVSVASLWEISIKHARRPAGMPISGSAALRYFQESGFQILPVSAAHAIAVERLPLLHGDPFDRMLIAQAMTDPWHLLTHDAAVAAYGGTIIAV